MTVALEEVDLTIGDSLHVGPHLITVLDIDAGQVTFRIENLETGELSIETARPARPK
jgi:hypothetical protein